MKLSLSRVNFKWITYLKYLLFCFFVIEKMNILMMLLTWIKFAFSIPRSEPMTRTEKFVQWSSLFAYCITGFSFIAAPQMYNIILGLDYQGRSEGYIRLFGISLVDIGVIFVILARCEDKVSRYGTIFISIFSRLLWVPITGVLLIVREMVPLSFALLFMVLDSCLALVTLLIWFSEERGPLLRTFCEELLAPLRACGRLKTRGSILIILSCFIIGLIQLIFWYIFVVRPDFAQALFKLEQFEGFASGYLSTFFYLISIHGLYHVLCALNLNSCLPHGSIFYRVLLDQPVFLILFFLEQIERNLFLVLLCIDVPPAIIVLLSLVKEGYPKESNKVNAMETTSLGYQAERHY